MNDNKLAPAVEAASTTRERLLSPIDRISEILFGLIMAITITGSLSVATAGSNEVRTVMYAALGCNLAWGLVDAVMYLMRTLTERNRNRALHAQVLKLDAEAGRQLLGRELPGSVSLLCGPAELEAMRQRLIKLEADGRLRRDDFLAALGIFLLVVLATFPVVVPYMVFPDLFNAKRVSQGVSVVLLFAAGQALGSYAQHPRPWLTGAAMTALGVALIGAVIALGG